VLYPGLTFSVRRVKHFSVSTVPPVLNLIESVCGQESEVPPPVQRDLIYSRQDLVASSFPVHFLRGGNRTFSSLRAFFSKPFSSSTECLPWG